jgi:uncharacterized protein (DUF362 family)
MTVNRRKFLIAAAGVTLGAAIPVSFLRPRYHKVTRLHRSRVAIVRTDAYNDSMEQTLEYALRSFPIDVKNKSVLLKPNLVDYSSSTAINTHPAIVVAAANCFRRRGARSVVVGEGPGHQRDTELVLEQSGLGDYLRQEGVAFVDLNRDELVLVRLKSSYTALSSLWFPRTVMNADYIVSMPKVKAHHWSGVTLSLKNMFGVVPGAKYGWPKNILHWEGIEQSILDICATVPIDFVIADGIVAMEGNGPLNGQPRQFGYLVLSDDAVSGDATCARLMGFAPERVVHIREAARFLGNVEGARIDQVGETVKIPEIPFDAAPGFRFLQNGARGPWLPPPRL